MNQCGSRARISSRNATSRGHSGQSRPGSDSRATGRETGPADDRRLSRVTSVVELFLIAPGRYRAGAALQELRRVPRLAMIARSRALRRVAAQLGLQFDQIGKHIRLPAQLVRDHRRLAGDRGNHGDADAAALHGLDQRAEIAVAGEQHDLVDMFGKLHGIDGELDVHVALHLAAAGLVDELLGRLGDHGVAVVVQPVDQRTNRRVFLILDNCGVVECADQCPPTLKFAQQSFVVDVKTQGFGSRVKIGPIDKKRNLVGGSRRHQLLSRIFVVVNAVAAHPAARPWWF